MERYRRMKGWNGTVYYIRMTKEEIRDRRQFEIFLILVLSVVSILTGCFIAMLT